MPLIKSKSKEALKKNIEVEMSAGKPQKQALAIAFDVQRRSKPKKMKDGGPIGDPSYGAAPTPKPKTTFEKNAQASDQYYDAHPHETFDDMIKNAKSSFAEGGEAEHIDMEAVARDLHKRLRDMKMEGAPEPKPTATPSFEEQMKPAIKSLKDQHMMAEGGEVADEEEYEEPQHASITDAIRAKNKFKNLGGDDEEGPATNREPNIEAKEFDPEESSEDYEGQPEDSNEHGHQLSDADKHDMIDTIRKKLKLGKK